MSQETDNRFAFPWYQKGLNFQCTQCGKCCTGAPGYVWVTDTEMNAMATFLKVSLADFKRLYTKRSGQKHLLIEKKSQNHNCIFYKDQKCQIYAVRPLQCQAYPFWKENIHSEKSWEQVTQECEGINADAPLIGFEIIQQWLDEQHQQNPDEHFSGK